MSDSVPEPRPGAPIPRRNPAMTQSQPGVDDVDWRSVLTDFYGPFKQQLDDAAAEKKWSCISAMPSQFGDRDSWQARTRPDVPEGDAERSTYLLGLVQTQIVKNAVIVPSGSKGGFITKRAPAEREAEVALLLAEGLSNDEIAGRLFLSPHTARRHTANIFEKLGVSSRTAATSLWTRPTSCGAR